MDRAWQETAEHGDAEVLQTLLDSGAALDETAKYTLSALMLATLSDHREIAEMLVAAGADTRIIGSGAPGFAGKTALDLATDLERDAIARLLRAAEARSPAGSAPLR